MIPEAANEGRIDVKSPFRQMGIRAIVGAMSLTGFDGKSLATLYLDKPFKVHTLMKAIARADRVHGCMYNGLIVEYCGIRKNLHSAPATFTGHTGGEEGGTTDPPARPQEEMLEELLEAIDMVRSLFSSKEFRR